MAFTYEELDKAVSEKTKQEKTGPAFSFEELEAAVGGPVSPSETPVEDLSFVEKVAESWRDRVGDVTDTFESYSKMPTNVNQEVPKDYIGTPEMVTQTVGSAAGFAFDMAGAAVSETGETLWRVLPDTFTSALSDNAREFAAYLANTEVGKLGLRAMQEGGKVLADFKAQYPEEYKTLSSSINVGLMANPLKKPSTSIASPEDVFRPPKQGPLGGRTLNDPIRGRDKDVFEVIKDTSKSAREKATSRTTAGGVLGRQQRMLNAEEAEMLDVVKKIPGVSSAKTMQENLNAINERIAKIGEGINAQLAKAQGNVSIDDLRVRINSNLNRVIEQNPGIFSVGNSTGMRSALKQAENMAYQAFRYIDEYGTSAAGLHKARQAFDQYYQKLAERSFKDGVTMPATIEESYKVIRNSLNESVDSLSPATRTARRQQSNLIKAAQNVVPKAANEAETALGRMYQSFGLGDAKTPFAVVANLPFQVGILAISPLYFASKQFQRFWKSAPIQNAQGRAAYVLRDMRKEFASSIKNIKDPEVRAQMNADLKAITAVINGLEQEAQENNNASP